MSDALRITVVRYQCPHCRRTHSKQAAADAHIARCWHNPGSRSCKTCVHYEPPDEGPYPEHPGWPEECGAGAGHVIPDDRPATGCPSWEPKQ